MQRLDNKIIDEVNAGRAGFVPEHQRREVDYCVANLAGTISDRPGGKGFGVKRARELIFALALFENRNKAQ